MQEADDELVETKSPAKIDIDVSLPQLQSQKSDTKVKEAAVAQPEESKGVKLDVKRLSSISETKHVAQTIQKGESVGPSKTSLPKLETNKNE